MPRPLDVERQLPGVTALTGVGPRPSLNRPPNMRLRCPAASGATARFPVASDGSPIESRRTTVSASRGPGRACRHRFRIASSFRPLCRRGRRTQRARDLGGVQNGTTARRPASGAGLQPIDPVGTDARRVPPCGAQRRRAPAPRSHPSRVRRRARRAPTLVPEGCGRRHLARARRPCRSRPHNPC